MKRILFVVFCLSVGTIDVFAQDYTHPRKMDLPKSEFQRPNPNDLRMQLDNGLVAYIVEDHNVPLVTITALIRAGTASDQKPGAAVALSSAMRLDGPYGETTENFKDKLHKMTADFQISMGPEITRIRLNVPVEDAWEALELLSNLLIQPRINQAVIDRLYNITARKTAPSESTAGETGPVLYEGSLTAAVERFKSILFADHSYGQKPTKEDFEALRLSNIKAFHQKYFAPGNTTIAFSGNFEMEQARQKFSESFAGWKSKSIPKQRNAKNLKTAKERQVFTYPSDKLQAWVVLGHELPFVPLKDQASLQIMNYILGGGHFDTRLFRETRDKRGLTNDDSGFLEPNWYGPGSYTFRTYGRPEVVNLLVELTLNEIEQIRSELVSGEELFVAKNALADGVFQMGFENGHATALTFAEEWLRYNNHHASASYVDRVNSVTKQDVLAAAKKYLHPERMQLVIVGPIEKVFSSNYSEGDFSVREFGEMGAGK